MNKKGKDLENKLNAAKIIPDEYLKKLTSSDFGKGKPRVVLLSPIAHENMKDPVNFPDGSANNKNLALYTKAMAEVAKANDVQFVDLFNPSLKLYADAAKKAWNVGQGDFKFEISDLKSMSPPPNRSSQRYSACPLTGSPTTCTCRTPSGLAASKLKKVTGPPTPTNPPPFFSEPKMFLLMLGSMSATPKKSVCRSW